MKLSFPAGLLLILVLLFIFNISAEKSFSKIQVSETCSSDGKIVEYKDRMYIEHVIVITCPTLPQFTTSDLDAILYAASHDHLEFTCEKYRSIFATTRVDCGRNP